VGARRCLDSGRLTSIGCARPRCHFHAAAALPFQRNSHPQFRAFSMVVSVFARGSLVAHRTLVEESVVEPS
jgi:hypothetical protein